MYFIIIIILNVSVMLYGLLTNYHSLFSCGPYSHMKTIAINDNINIKQNEKIRVLLWLCHEIIFDQF